MIFIIIMGIFALIVSKKVIAIMAIIVMVHVFIYLNEDFTKEVGMMDKLDDMDITEELEKDKED